MVRWSRRGSTVDTVCQAGAVRSILTGEKDEAEDKYAADPQTMSSMIFWFARLAPPRPDPPRRVTCGTATRTDLRARQYAKIAKIAKIANDSWIN